MDWEALREEFPITRNYNFQNHAAVAPPCRRAVEAAKRQLDRAAQYSYVESGFYREAERVRQLAARLIGAQPDEVCFVKNTSEGISFVANGLTWQRGDNVVTTNVEFPANMYPWQALRSRGVELRMVLEENGRIPMDRLLETINSRTRLVAISSIQFGSGFQIDLRKLGEFCTAKGVLLCVDAIQSLGAFPIDVRDMHIDFLSADGHKWLCATEGIGIFFVRKEVQGFLQPTTIGWLSMKNAWDFDKYQFEFQDSAKRYDSGAYNLTGIHALGGALDLLAEVGQEAITSRLLHLTDMLVTGLRDKGYLVVSSRDRGEASSIVSFQSDYHDPKKIQTHLEREHRLIIAVRNGRLRASPHFYNTPREIEQLIDLLPKH